MECSGRIFIWYPTFHNIKIGHCSLFISDINAGIKYLPRRMARRFIVILHHRTWQKRGVEFPYQSDLAKNRKNRICGKRM